MLDQNQTPLLSAMLARLGNPHAPFYTPGHKLGRGLSPLLLAQFQQWGLQLDLSELPGLDNLAAPEGVIAESQALAAEAFGAEQTWFLVNGSTCGIIAAILATCPPGAQVLLPRTVHQSVIAGLILAGAEPVWAQPEYDSELGLTYSLTPETVATALSNHPQIRAVLLVYPTYEGVCGDLAEIAKRAHARGIPLLVDEAHGPHFYFHSQLPPAALALGADLVVQSTHKVLSGFTQAAMLHVQGALVERGRVSAALRLVQSSSPSYLLLASLEVARQQMALQGETILAATLELAAQARQFLQHIPQLWALAPEHANRPGFLALDLTRLTVRVSGLGLTGYEADEMLSQEWGVVAELPTPEYLVFILSLGNTATDVERLCAGLQGLAARQASHSGTVLPSLLAKTILPLPAVSQPALSPRAAFFAERETIIWEQCVGRVSAELVCPYPPGIPVLLPGEVITSTTLDYLQAVAGAGGQITGCQDCELKTLQVIRR
jgi:arginine decarboxylase